MKLIDNIMRVVKGHTLSYVRLATGCDLNEEDDYEDFVEVITEDITNILANKIEVK